MSSTRTKYDHQKETRFLQGEDSVLFQEALRFRNNDEFHKAIGVLTDLADRNPEDPAIVGVLGSTYYQIGEYEEAVHHLRITTRLSPRSELASRGLFHSLLNLERHEEAKTELRRFIELTGSEEFKAILSEQEGKASGQ